MAVVAELKVILFLEHTLLTHEHQETRAVLGENLNNPRLKISLNPSLNRDWRLHNSPAEREMSTHKNYFIDYLSKASCMCVAAYLSAVIQPQEMNDAM